jgi:hypothetical protein
LPSALSSDCSSQFEVRSVEEVVQSPCRGQVVVLLLLTTGAVVVLVVFVARAAGRAFCKRKLLMDQRE